MISVWWSVIVLCVVAGLAEARWYASPAELTGHTCHVLAETDWTAEGRVEQIGTKGDDLVLLVALPDGCRCVIVVADWLDDLKSIPKGAQVRMRGVTLQELHGTRQPFPVAVELDLQDER